MATDASRKAASQRRSKDGKIIDARTRIENFKLMRTSRAKALKKILDDVPTMMIAAGGKPSKAVGGLDYENAHLASSRVSALIAREGKDTNEREKTTTIVSFKPQDAAFDLVFPAAENGGSNTRLDLSDFDL